MTSPIGEDDLAAWIDGRLVVRAAAPGRRLP